MNKLQSLLEELRQDDYVRFKYGKRIDAALKALDAQKAVDAAAIESGLTELLALVRGQKGGAQASPGSKRRRAPAKAPAEA